MAIAQEIKITYLKWHTSTMIENKNSMEQEWNLLHSEF